MTTSAARIYEPTAIPISGSKPVRRRLDPVIQTVVISASIVAAAVLIFVRIAGHAQVTSANYAKVRLQRELQLVMEQNSRLTEALLLARSGAALEAYASANSMTQSAIAPMVVERSVQVAVR